MFRSMSLRFALKSTPIVLREGSVLSRLKGTCLALPLKYGACVLPVNGAEHHEGICAGSFAIQPVRNYARAVRKKKQVFQSQLSDLCPTMLKMEYANVPLAQTTDDLVKRLLTLELASHKEKLCLKREQLIAKVKRDVTDTSSPEVRIASLTAKIRNYQEHLHTHAKDKANKRRMLMAIDRRKKLLKNLRMTRYDAFEHVCKELDITYTFPPLYYRRATKRWLAKKALCKKVYQEVQKMKAEKRKKMKISNPQADPAETAAAGAT